MQMTASESQKRPKRPVDLRDPIEVLRQEKFITARDLASAFSTMGRPWTARQARVWMQRSGIAFQLVPAPDGRKEPGAHGGQWFTTRARLRREFPDVMDMIDQERLDRADDDD